LNLCSNDITDAGVKLLAESLNKCAAPRLERIDLSRNRIGSSGCAHLAVPIRLRRLPLRYLDLSFNPLSTPPGGRSAPTSSSSSSATVSTAAPTFDFDGVAELMKSLEVHNRTLAELNLRCCGLVHRSFERSMRYRPPSLETAEELRGLRAVAAMLRKNTSLLRLDIRGNAVSARLRRIVDAAVSEVPTAIGSMRTIRDELDRCCRSVLLRNPTYPRASRRWLRVRLYRRVLPLLEAKREVLV